MSKEVHIRLNEGSEVIVVGAKDMIVQDWGVVLTQPFPDEAQYETDPNRIPRKFLPWGSIYMVDVIGDEEPAPVSKLVVAKLRPEDLGPLRGASS